METKHFHQLNRYVHRIQQQIKATAAATYVIQHDLVVNEWYSGRHDHTASSRMVDAHSQFNVGSVRKTYLAMAISLLIEEGKIRSIDDEVGLYLNELYATASGITIRHCLTHTHGLEIREGQYSRAFRPGEDWAYNNAGITILIVLVARLTGQSLASYIIDNVIQPLGFTETGWRTRYNELLIYNHYHEDDNWVGPNDSSAGDQSNLFISARELAAWGNLHLHKGKINGEQVYPKSVFDRMTSLQTPKTLHPALPRQGFIWWLQSHSPLNQIGDQVPHDSFQVLGITGCACLVIPQYKAVAVRMYNQLHNPQGYDYLEDIRQFGNEVHSALQASAEPRPLP